MQVPSSTRSRIASVAVMAALVFVQPAAQAEGGHARAQLVASAQPSPATPTVTESLTSWDKVGKGGKTTTSATASAVCDGCTADASALHVVRTLGGGGATADNVATAWATTCTGCSATAVSIQVVLAVGSGPVVANNRSLAVNAACTGCSTAATAVQFVLVGSKRSELTDAAEALLGQLTRELRQELAQSTPAQGKAARAGSAPLRTEGDLRSIEGRLLQRDVGATSVTVRVARHIG
jgi:hypothetical protein